VSIEESLLEPFYKNPPAEMLVGFDFLLTI